MPHSGAMLIRSTSVRSLANEMAVTECDLAQGDLMAVRKGMGGALRTLYSDVLREGIPDRIAELLSQLDQKDSDSA
jgi:hypothetical protein